MIIYLRCADVNTQNYNFCLLVTLTNKLCNVFLLLEPPLQRINFFFSSASHKCFKTYFIQTFCTVEKSRNIHIYMEEILCKEGLHVWKRKHRWHMDPVTYEYRYRVLCGGHGRTIQRPGPTIKYVLK